MGTPNFTAREVVVNVVHATIREWLITVIAEAINRAEIKVQIGAGR